MNATILPAALAALLLAAPARAENKGPAAKGGSVFTFFKNLKSSLAQSAVAGERKKGRTGSVAAVRGEDQAKGSKSAADPNDTTLKGASSARKAKASAAEDKEFEAAVDLIIAGKTDEGVKALEEFKAKHPKSRNLPKVDEAIAQAKAMSSESKAAEKAAPAEAEKAEPGK